MEITQGKSSNEILTELFGSFNAEPPIIKAKLEKRSKCDSKRSKKLKRSKSKKSKKHKHKSKKRKKKSTPDSGHSSETEDQGNEKKKKENSPNGIKLPLDIVPGALEILLDGTVGIKREDGSLVQIVNEEEEDIKETESKIESDNEELITESKSVQNVIKGTSILTEVFEPNEPDPGEQKKGKIQIKNLKFSNVYQETVKAVEEKQKLLEEKKANYEEGELSTDSNSSESEKEDIEEDKIEKHRSGHKRKHRSGHKGHSKSHYRDDHKGRKRKRSSSRSRSSRRSRSRDKRHRRSKSRHDMERDHDRRRDHHSNAHSYSSSSRSHKHRSRSKDKKERCKDVKEKTRSDEREKIKEHCSTEKIDKNKLLAIARRNALKMIDAGVLPGSEKMASIKAGGKTVNELTEYCKKLSKKEALGDDVSDIVSDSNSEDEKLFHHPFTVKDRPNSIVMNIKNSTPLPVKSLQEKTAEQSKQLRLQFPVSSGSSHRRTENEWVPVTPSKKEEEKKKPAPVVKPAVCVPVEAPPPPLPPAPPVPFINTMTLSAVPPPDPVSKPVFPVIQPGPVLSKLDISSIVSRRLEAMRRLQENPNDSHALSQMYNAQQEMQYWAESKQETGAFTGSTGAKVLTAQELSSGVQAWAKRDQLTNATPVKGGMGMALLQKMGWQPGEGLGKNKEGTLEPLKLEVKMDKKGLLAADEAKKGKKGGAVVQSGPPLPTVKTLDGKHPVSLLNEFCSRRRYGVPQFDLCFECGPDHKKSFLFKVKVNGVEYAPNVASPNKKQAKAEAAAICLRALGVISNNPTPANSAPTA